jgi:transposase
MPEGIRFVGLDVSKASIAVSVAGASSEPEDHGTINNDAAAIRNLVRRLGDGGRALRVAYEAGPTGYAIHRQLSSMGIDCIVAAPSLIPTRSGDRVKTDRRDAAKLARLLRSGDLTAVWVPDEEHEGLRDLVRARDDARADLLRADHRLSKFLLRRAVLPPPGIRARSKTYEAWLGRLSFGRAAEQAVFDDYLAVVREARERLKRLEVALFSVATTGPHGEFLKALQALRGIGFLTAVTIVAEAGDLRRFPTARQFMAYVGLVPSEHSSGATRHRGHITKTGNHLLRHVLGQAAHHSRHRPAVGAALRSRQAAVPPAFSELDRRAQRRLHQRYRHLAGRIGVPKAVTAVARELAGVVWAAASSPDRSTDHRSAATGPTRRRHRPAPLTHTPTTPGATADGQRHRDPSSRALRYRLAPIDRGTSVTGSLPCGHGFG